MRPFVGRPWPLVYRKNHGVVELCAFKQHLSILYFLLGAQKTEEHRAAIWCRLVRMARRHIDIDATLALRTLKMMTEPPPPPPPPPTHDLELVVRSLLSCFNHISDFSTATLFDRSKRPFGTSIPNFVKIGQAFQDL